MKLVLSVFYQQRINPRVRTKITELFLKMKLLVFIDLEMLLILENLNGFWLVEIIVFPRNSQMRIAAFIVLGETMRR